MDPSLDILDNGNGGDFTTAPVEAPESLVPKPDSPRTLWSRENRAKLDKKEEEEKAAKEELMKTARQYLEQYTADRLVRIEATKKANREEELKTQEMKEKPEGTLWQQIIHMIDFDLGVQQKDVSRARSLLFQAKDANLPTK